LLGGVGRVICHGDPALLSSGLASSGPRLSGSLTMVISFLTLPF
jgi:hypothetical protein